MCSIAIVKNVLVDFVGDGEHVVLDAKIANQFQLFRLNTFPVGLFGVLTMMALVWEWPL